MARRAKSANDIFSQVSRLGKLISTNGYKRTGGYGNSRYARLNTISATGDRYLNNMLRYNKETLKRKSLVLVTWDLSQG
jgi:hypothetical protein